MTELVLVTLISSVAALAGAFIGMMGAVWAADRAKKLDQDSERNSVDAALRAEIKHVRDVAKEQLGYIRDGSSYKLKAGVLDEPLHWMPIRIAVWDQLRSKVGLLPAARLAPVVDFFAYVSWVNEMVAVRERISRDKLETFAEKYITALETIEQKASAASTPPATTATGASSPGA